MNKKVLATALLGFSLLLTLLPMVSAVNSFDFQLCTIEHFAKDRTLSPEELLVLPSYVTFNEEPTNPIYEDGGPYIPNYSPDPVRTMVIVDDDAIVFFELALGWTTGASPLEWAAAILERGDDKLWDWFRIDFVAVEGKYWESPQTDIVTLLAYAITTFTANKPSGVDVVYVLTGQNYLPIGGICSPAYSTFVISAWSSTWTIPLQNLWQHEASHLYYAKDHAFLDFTPCIMNSFYFCLITSWCGGCSETISRNRYRFG